MRAAHRSFAQIRQTSGLEMPENRSAPGQPDLDRVMRYLDCAVIRHLHGLIEEQPENERVLEPFDTVRGMFTEGGRLYPGSGFYKKTHVQIAVRNSDCIRGLFIPRPYPGD